MNLNSWELFFNQLVRNIIFKRGSWEYYNKTGVLPARAWPDCIARDLAIEFENSAKNKTVDVAKMLLAPRAQLLSGLDMPSHDFEIIGMFERFKTFATAKQLAKAIDTSPEQVASLIHNFENNSIASIDTFDIATELKRAIVDQEAALLEKRAVVELERFEQLSNKIGGWNPGRIFLITAETGMGKTTFALNLTLSALKKFSVLYFNMEMMPKDISVRLMQIGSGLTTAEWRSGAYVQKQQRILDWINKLEDQNKLRITTGAALSLEQLSAKILCEKQLSDIGFVIVDYDQKIRSVDRGEEWQLLQRSVEELEEIAKMCEIPIVILAQANKEGGPRASGRITQSASAVIRLHKENDQHFIELLKNRFGPKDGRIGIIFDQANMQMTEDIIPWIPPQPLSIKGFFSNKPKVNMYDE